MTNVLNLGMGMVFAIVLGWLCDVPLENAMTMGLLLFIGHGIGDIARAIGELKNE